MSFTKKGRKFRSDSGKEFPDGPKGAVIGNGQLVRVIADALRRDFGGTNAAIKRVATLSGANERAVKNWFSAKNGPSGEFLVILMRHSGEVLDSVLTLANRSEAAKARKMADAFHKLGEMRVLIDQILDD
jgi:hypothetical protein